MIRARFLILLARFALLFERLTPLFLHIFLVAGSFGVLALSGLLPRLPGWGHLALLGLFLLTFTGLAGRDFRRLRLPRKNQAMQRLEQHNHLPHGPLSALHDRPALGQNALWESHLARMRQAIRALRPCPPRPQAARIDPFGLRFIVLLALVFMTILHGDDARHRITQSLQPKLTMPAFWILPDFEARIIPPAFTELPSLLLNAGQNKAPLRIPAGSLLQIHLPAQLAKHARIYAKGLAIPFRLRKDGSAAMTLVLDQNDNLQLKGRIRTLARWNILILPDTPPEAVWTEAPSATAQNNLSLPFHASDDYGLETLVLRITRDSETLDFPLSANARKTVDGPAFLDLTAHPWAGAPVSLSLIAMDARGQMGEAPPVSLTLPERVFTHPVAKALVAIRKNLMETGNRGQARMQLEGLATHPGAFDGDFTVFLALRAASARLAFNHKTKATSEVADLLWKTALRLEDGGLSLALEKLESIRQQLEQALDNPDTSDAEIAALMEQFSRAFAEYLQTLAENMERGMMASTMAPAGMDLSDLANAFSDMKAMAESGARDAARDMLSALSDLLQGISLKAQNPATQAFWQAFSDLQTLVERQDALLNDTFKAKEEDLPGLGAEQDALQKALGETAQSLEALMGGVPDPLTQAGNAMGEAARLLKNGQGQLAQQAQAQALSDLKDSLKNMMQQAMSGGGSGQGSMPMGMGGSDPFGRMQGGADIFGRPVDIETRKGLAKTREILKSLREKAGDMRRPPQERDYMNRLLKRF
ncbi:MAG TPA: hypothetical protein DCW68_03960 [Rhodospirillaceae bacterium]|nr:MAG: hypothetical protein A2018_07145 [Alphaproteobacteria bacterium GWF2_58_20]HAU29250.1 hypothetical protein [Rhodospirillaceae bacterium]